MTDVDDAQQHDLSALDGLLGDLDIADVPTEDPRAAKLQALFEHAKATYTAKIDSPRWFLDDIAEHVPPPHKLMHSRRADRSAATLQEWTVNYLYTNCQYEACLSYAVSFAQSMKIPFPFGESWDFGEQPSASANNGAYQRRSKEERDLSKNWGIVKDIADAGMRCISALIRTHADPAQPCGRTAASAHMIHTWAPSDDSYVWERVSLLTLAQGFMTFARREIRLGTGDPRYGYAGMVIRDAQTDKRSLDLDKVHLHNWTVSFGIALTLGNLALQLGYFRVAIESHALFLANRGLMWRVLLSLAHALHRYSEEQSLSNKAASKAMLFVAKGAAVSAIQSSPKQSRSQVADIVLSGAVLPSHVLRPNSNTSSTSSEFVDKDQLLFDGFLAVAPDTVPPLADEIAICLVNVIFAKKGGVIEMRKSFDIYIREYTSRTAQSANQNPRNAMDMDDIDDGADEIGPRSVRTL